MGLENRRVIINAQKYVPLTFRGTNSLSAFFRAQPHTFLSRFSRPPGDVMRCDVDDDDFYARHARASRT